MNHCVWIFPGQGSQNLEMLNNIHPKYFEWIKEIANKDFLQSEPDFSNTVDIQLALLITELNSSELLKQEQLLPDLVAGHSLGAFSAAVTAGVIDAKDAIQLVYKRASLMANLYPTDYGMAAIVGLNRTEVENIVKNIHTSSMPLYVSNQNEELQLTISGHWDAIDTAIEHAKSMNSTMAKRLSVPTPSHSILMQPVSDELAIFADSIEFNAPNCGYLGNCTGRLLTTQEEIKKDLIHNVTHPVLWLDMMQAAVEHGAQHFIELPPGRSLSKLVERSYPNVKTYAVEQYGILDTVFLFKKWSKDV